MSFIYISTCWLWALRVVFAAKPGRLLDTLLKLVSQPTHTTEKRESRLMKLFVEYGIIADATRSESKVQVRSLLSRPGEQTIDYLMNKLAIAASSSMSQQASGGYNVSVEVQRLVAMLLEVTTRFPSRENTWRMLSLVSCFAHAHWSGYCAVAVTTWHDVAGKPDWIKLLKDASKKEGVDVLTIMGFLFERLWLDSGAFELFTSIVGANGYSSERFAGIASALVPDVGRVVADDWAWYTSQRKPSAQKKLVSLLMPSPSTRGVLELEQAGAWSDLGAKLVRKVLPAESCRKVLKHLRTLGNSSNSGLEYPIASSHASDRPEAQVWESLYRVSWALSPDDEVVKNFLHDLLTAPSWPQLLNGSAHILELGFYEIYPGAAAQGFHRDSYKVTPPGPHRATQANYQLVLNNVTECAPLEVIIGSHSLKESKLCANCPRKKDVQGRRLRALLPTLGAETGGLGQPLVRIAPLTEADLVVYDPRLYHRGSSCAPSATTSRAVFWFTLAIDASPQEALSRAEHLPPNPYLRSLWKSGRLLSEQELRDWHRKDSSSVLKTSKSHGVEL